MRWLSKQKKEVKSLNKKSGCKVLITMRRRLLIVSLAAYPLFNQRIEAPHGGAELDLYNIARFLDKSLFDVHFIVGDYGQKEMEIFDQVAIHRGQKISQSHFISGLKNFIHLFSTIRKINPDVIFSEATGWMTVELLIVKILLRKKFVFRSAHENNINGLTDSRPYGFLYRLLMNHIDFFILQNEQDRELFQKIFSFKNNTEVIRNLQPIPSNQPLKYENRKHILWVGRSELIKDPALFVLIASKLPMHHFIMIMPKTNQGVFDDTINSLKTIKNLTIIPGVKWSEVMPYFENAKYFISTSIKEGFPNVLLEAMKYGTPIISARLDFDSILSKEGVGLVTGDSADTIADVIQNMPIDDWNAYSRNAKAFAINNFDITKKIYHYEKIFLSQ